MAKKPLNAGQTSYLADMRKEAGTPSQSPLDLFLTAMRNHGGEEFVQQAEADIIETFQTEAGLRVLKTFEKAVLHNGVPNGAPEGALREMNAVRNFVLNIRRIVAHG